MSNVALQIEMSALASTAAGANVIFNTVVYTSGNISYNSGTGVITFQEAGRYAINWWAATQSSLSANGIAFTLSSSQGDALIGNSPIKTGEVFGTGIIDIVAPPVTVSLINTSAAAIFYSSIVPLKASLIVLEDDIAGIGPTGATGTTGATGSTGAGITTFGYVYNLDPAQESAILLGSDILFDTNGPLSGVLHTPGTAVITVPDTANYLADYTIVITNNVDLTVALAVNGVVAASTSVPTLTVTGEFSNASILPLNAGALVTLRSY